MSSAIINPMMYQENTISGKLDDVETSRNPVKSEIISILESNKTQSPKHGAFRVFEPQVRMYLQSGKVFEALHTLVTASSMVLDHNQPTNQCRQETIEYLQNSRNLVDSGNYQQALKQVSSRLNIALY